MIAKGVSLFLILLLSSCYYTHVPVVEPQYLYEITRYSRYGTVIERYVYIKQTPDPIQECAISFTIQDTTYVVMPEITIKRWKIK